jgi:hypothetical protein
MGDEVRHGENKPNGLLPHRKMGADSLAGLVRMALRLRLPDMAPAGPAFKAHSGSLTRTAERKWIGLEEIRVGQNRY